MSSKAKMNFALDLVVAAAGVLSAVSGIVLLLVPGGYQGGANPYYGQDVLWLGHHQWSDLHTWTSLVAIAGVLVHLVLHWKWIVCMFKRGLAFEQRSRSQVACPVTVEEL